MLSMRNFVIVALIAVALGTALWFMTSKGILRNTRGQMARPESLSAAARPEPRPPTAKAAATPSDHADTSEEKTTGTPDATAGQAIAQPPATATAPAAIVPAVARFVDASLPVAQRMAEIGQLGQRGDADAVQTLMKRGDTYTYLNFAAVEALGNVKTPEVARYLEGKTLQHEYGSQVVAAFKAIGDPAGVPALEAYVLRLQTQCDGMDKNPMGQHDLAGKIKEVRDVIAFIQQKGQQK